MFLFLYLSFIIELSFYIFNIDLIGHVRHVIYMRIKLLFVSLIF